MDIELQKEKFGQFTKERLPVLHAFSQGLGFSNSHEILNNPKSFLSSIDEWLAQQEIEEENKVWLATRIGYFIGEYFIEKYDGCWSVCEASDSRYYGYFVVGEFSGFNNTAALFDPMGAAFELTSTPKGRSLVGIIKEIEGALSQL